MSRSCVRHRRDDGDVHCGTMAGDVPAPPGSRTEAGRRAVAELMDDHLDRVRRHIRRRDRSVAESSSPTRVLGLSRLDAHPKGGS
jgi:hypothetical protein